MSRLLFVAYFLEVGLVLIVVPWSSYWDRNFFADSLPVLASIAHNNFVRGAVTGLGVLNVFAGLSDLATVLGSRRGARDSWALLRLGASGHLMAPIAAADGHDEPTGGARPHPGSAEPGRPPAARA